MILRTFGMIALIVHLACLSALYGYEDTRVTDPGWGHMLAAGATTLWEQWNGHWSRIHSRFTSPDNWLYQGLAGIQADPDASGFKNVIIKPEIVGDLKWVKSHHDSPYGRIASNWSRGDGKLKMEITIPPNSTATIYVPTEAASDVMVNGSTIEEADHVTFLNMDRGRTVLRVDSGSYTVTTSLPHDYHLDLGCAGSTLSKRNRPNEEQRRKVNAP